MKKIEGKYVLVSSYSGDWEGLYVDGVLGPEGHSVSLREAFSALGLRLVKVEAEEEFLESRGSLPENLDEVEVAP